MTFWRKTRTEILRWSLENVIVLNFDAQDLRGGSSPWLLGFGNQGNSVGRIKYWFDFMTSIWTNQYSELCGCLWMAGLVDGWVNRWMDGWVNRWMDGWMDEWIDGWMDEWIDGWMDGWVNRWVDGWIDEWVENDWRLDQRIVY